MHKGSKLFVALMAMLVMTFASCATKDKIPSEPPPPEPTTTTTVPAPIVEPGPSSGTTTVVPPVVVQQPSVSEIELRNLFGQANALKSEAVAYGVDKVLPDDYTKVNSDFTAVKAEYDGIMDQVGYDGVKAFPLKGKLENSVASWEELLAKGLPMRADEESEKAAGLKLAAISAGARELAADRFEGAESLLADADALDEKASYTMAIPAYQQAAAAFDVTAEKAKANELRSTISDKDYAKYAENFFVAGEQKYYAEEELWAAGSLADLKAGANTLRDANAYYGYVVSSGAEGKALEAKEAALTAQDKALALGADRNAPEQYALATDIMNEALANHEAGNFESAYLWFVDAEAAYNDAAEASSSLKAENEAALASAREAVASAEKKQAAAGVEDTVYLPEAQYYLSRAEIQSENAVFVDSTFNANEAKNYAGMSERFLDGIIAEQEAVAAEKAKADQAMGDAKTRMAWAENNNIAEDYPDQYKAASTSMKSAELAHAGECYAPAADLAGEVSTILSDDFQASVLAEREEAAAVAAAKANADTAMDDARTRMAWAENNNIAEDYPDEYKAASTSMKSAELAYAGERYAPAADLAGEVSTIFSDDFQASVLAEREEAAAVAAAKAEADTAMADAQDRMAWANENGIKEDYPEEYGTASTAMVSSFNAYGKGEYTEATTKAGEVSSILSDDFKAQVQMDREEAAAVAAAKADADTAMDDARTRMAWAENNNIAEDYPDEYKAASTSMKSAELAYAGERYAPAADLAGEVSEVLSDDFQAHVLAEREDAQRIAAEKAEADVAMNDARTRMTWAENNNIAEDYPDEYKAASSSMKSAELAYAGERYAPAADLAGEVSATLSDEFMQKVLADREASDKTSEATKAADDAAKNSAYTEIDNAQARYDWARDNNAVNNYPELFAKGGADLAKAKQAYGDGKFVDASASAKEAMKSLSSIKAFAELPAVYIVRLIPERRDCLWRIAEYPFIYNNPLKWPVLYEANKKTFRDPSNPDLIFPDQVLNIPAIKGEARSGTWDPKKTYNPLPKK